MEIRDPIHGAIELSDIENRVVDSAAYQRLRAIKQLGFSEFSFPGATHNRYLHSLGVSHLAGVLFDSLFKKYKFKTPSTRDRLRQAVKLGALLHDIGHGPLSHTTEEVMPKVSELNIEVYKNRRQDLGLTEKDYNLDRQANHEDYSIKFITDSSLTEVLKSSAQDMDPLHVACLIDKTLVCPDDFFIDQGVNFRTLLSQIVSSEMDVDRMDYLERDAYYCGTSYGKVDLHWLIANITMHISEGEAFLALSRKALYTFDDFLLSRHHMHLMVYFHHKSIIYEELLYRYLTSSDCQFSLPSNIEEYIIYNDYKLFQDLASSNNEWAKRIAERKPYKVLFELHSNQVNDRIEAMKLEIEKQGIPTILASAGVRLSKYHTASESEKAFPIFVVDKYDPRAKPYTIEACTEIFQKYEDVRHIERLYVVPDKLEQAEQIIIDKKL